MHRDIATLIVVTTVLATAARGVAQGTVQAPSIEAAQKAAAAAREQQSEDQKQQELLALARIKPLKVLVVIATYQGDKKISSKPYTLSVNSGDATGAKLRMGAQVALPTAATPVLDGKTVPYGGPVQYRDIGTNIDCSASQLADGRFQLRVTIENASVYAEDIAAAQISGSIPPPAIRSFRVSNSAILKDGQSTEFSTATDAISGELTRIDITLNVVK